ncbi:N-acetyltransferase [Micromonospora sp. NBC_01699]|uniref:GNAT family N-acetyltransferase n=1 Tax=Micromonospora sp. NBC_01699 TaxID=2975984 RepID=UPI002E2F9858|nr:GNAT family N-acetyltransferase [Micromonospora sp. NBC_01699]
MTNTNPEPTVELDEAGHRYTITVAGAVAGFARYFDNDGQRVFFHTEIDKEYGGQGLGGRLVGGALDHVRAAGLRIVPICPFVKSYLGRHHQFDDLIDPVTPNLLARIGA